jgi:hypothetical protein
VRKRTHGKVARIRINEIAQKSNNAIDNGSIEHRFEMDLLNRMFLQCIHECGCEINDRSNFRMVIQVVDDIDAFLFFFNKFPHGFVFGLELLDSKHAVFNELVHHSFVRNGINACGNLIQFAASDGKEFARNRVFVILSFSFKCGETPIANGQL